MLLLKLTRTVGKESLPRKRISGENCIKTHLFLFMCMCYDSVSVKMAAEDRSHQISCASVTGNCDLPDMSAGSQTLVLSKNRMCS